MYIKFYEFGTFVPLNQNFLYVPKCPFSIWKAKISGEKFLGLGFSLGIFEEAGVNIEGFFLGEKHNWGVSIPLPQVLRNPFFLPWENPFLKTFGNVCG